MYRDVDDHPALQAVSQNLSITTFRFVPPDLPADQTGVEPYLNELNAALLNQLQTSGVAFVSNALVDGKYLLRACIVNFRITLADIEALPPLVAQLGRRLDAKMRPQTLQRDWGQRINMNLLFKHSHPSPHAYEIRQMGVSHCRDDWPFADYPALFL